MTYTLDELKQLIWDKDKINNQYKNNGEEFLKDFNSEKIPEKWTRYNGRELWRKYTKNDNFFVSNFGRVKIGENGEICEQIDETPLTGYLYLKDYKNLEKQHGKIGVDYIYQMVAETWFDGINGKIVHHITNDGYDNRPENLILVSKEEHGKIHSLASYRKKSKLS